MKIPFLVGDEHPKKNPSYDLGFTRGARVLTHCHFVTSATEASQLRLGSSRAGDRKLRVWDDLSSKNRCYVYVYI